MIARGWLGEKAGQGFYKREKNADGESEILTLDPATLDVPRRSSRHDSPRSRPRGRSRTLRERITTLFAATDKVGAFLRETLGADARLHRACGAGRSRYSIDDVDRVMRWGFGWELGPFELIDAIGVDAVVNALAQAASRGDVPPLIRAVLDTPAAIRSATAAARRAGPRRSYGRRRISGDRPQERRRQPRRSRRRRARRRVPLEDERDRRRHDRRCSTPASRKPRANFAALVVGNDAPNFSAGANLMLLLLEAQEGNWDEIDLMVRAFQARDAGAALRGRAGRRRARRADARRRLRDRAARRPRAGGGGELHRPGRGRRRADSRPAAARRRCWRARSTALPAPRRICCRSVQRVFETIGFAKVSTSARRRAAARLSARRGRASR